MQQDINKIIDYVSNGWAGDLANARKQIAILAEENERLKQEVESLKEEQKEEEK